MFCASLFNASLFRKDCKNWQCQKKRGRQLRRSGRHLGGRDLGSSWVTRIMYFIHWLLKWPFPPMQSPRNKIRLSLVDCLSGFMASEFVITNYHIIQDKRSLEGSSCCVLELQCTVQCISCTSTSPHLLAVVWMNFWYPDGLFLCMFFSYIALIMWSPKGL